MTGRRPGCDGSSPTKAITLQDVCGGSHNIGMWAKRPDSHRSRPISLHRIFNMRCPYKLDASAWRLIGRAVFFKKNAETVTTESDTRHLGAVDIGPAISGFKS